jgi:methyl-accepting chemotaxis protein
MMKLSDVKIGTKLGITSGLSILLVCGMLLNEHWAQDEVAKLNERAASQVAIRAAINSSRTQIAVMQSLRRDINLSTNGTNVDRSLERLQKAAADTQSLLDSAFNRMAQQENRERISKIKTLQQAWVAAVVDLSSHQKKLLSEQQNQRDIVGQWSKSYDAFMSSSALANLPRQSEVETNLRAADVGMKDSRIGFWRYVSLQDAPSADLAQRAVAQTQAALKRVRDQVGDRGLIALVDDMTKEVNEVGSSIAETKKAIESRAQIERERTAPTRIQAEELMDAAMNVAVTNANGALKAAADAAANAARVSFIIGLFVVGMLLATAMFAIFAIARPLRELVRPLELIANGNFAVTVPGADRKDEVGQIAGAVRAMADKVRSTIAEVKQSAREVTNASAEISTSTTDLSQRTEEQAASLEETSASMEEISATVKKNAENAQQANASAAQTREVADRGGEVVAKAVDAMAKIEESSRKISDIIGVIDEIARQTNLLALNAAVEAARAGEAGRGFAVVASEVRSLAQRSSQAAKDIKDLIVNSNSQVKDGVELVNQAGAALNEIVESIKQVAAIVNDIANASMEQSTGIEQVNKALTQMDEVTQQNSALVEENAATAKTLEHQAKAMDEQVSFFQIDAAAGAEGMAYARSATSRPASGRSASRAVAAESADMPPAAHKSTEAAPRRAASGGARQMQTNLATAIKADSEWKEF